MTWANSSQAGAGSDNTVGAAGTGKKHHVMKGIVAVSVEAASASVTVTDGTNTLIGPIPADIAGATSFDFTDKQGTSGYPCAANGTITLTVAGGAATASLTVGYITKG